ncbi:MAG: UbiX family flavin prenyltransferase [Gammaproteobacteria bacterium]
MQKAFKPMIIGITGASGSIYGIRLLETLRRLKIETHLVMSDSSKMTLRSETEFKIQDVTQLATYVHHYKNIGAIISSGSFITAGMIIAPCSMHTLSEISVGISSNLISRSADVILKERRRLVLLTRETPLHAGHIRAMGRATENGAIIMPPVPAFYAKPKTLDDIVNYTVMRCLDLFEIHTDEQKRWQGFNHLPSEEGISAEKL